MRKLITIFFISVGILYAVFIIHKNNISKNEILIHDNLTLKVLHNKSKKCCKWLEDFNKTFKDMKILSNSSLEKIIKDFANLTNVKIEKLFIKENIFNIEVSSINAEDVILFLKCVSDKKLSLGILPKQIQISRTDNNFNAEIKIVSPNVPSYIAKLQNQKLDENLTTQIYKKYYSPIRLSLFNPYVIYEGNMNKQIMINGEWIPENYEDQNFSLMMIDNSTIMLNVKKLMKTFHIKLGVREIIAP